MARTRVERLSSGDLTSLVTDVGPVPMNVGALLVLDADPATDPAAVATLLAERLAGIPRLRQRLVTAPPGLGRPYWLDVPGFDASAHVTHRHHADAADLDRLLDVAAVDVTTPLPRTAPLWRATVITCTTPGRVGVVVTMHHVLADGIGGLAILAGLVDEAQTDGAASPRGTASPRETATLVPRPRDLAADVTAARVAAIRRLPRAVAGLRHGRTELGSRTGGAPRCSLNSPTGTRRQVLSVSVALSEVRAAGRRHGATVNDVLLVAVVGAMAEILRARGDDVPALVVSVPVSARRSTTSTELGNQVGVMPVRVPLEGTRTARLAAVAAATRTRKAHGRGASAALVGPTFRLLARLRLFHWLVDRQRLVNAFLTNVPGPATTLTLAGAPVTRLIPITITAGNVGVAFAALSYGGNLAVSVIADPDVVPEVERLADALRAELAALAEL